MFTKNSIRREFTIQLILASATLIVIFSSILYFYIEKSIYDDKAQELIENAKSISDYKTLEQQSNNSESSLLGYSIELIKLRSNEIEAKIYEDTKKKHNYMILIYPFEKDKNNYLKITKDITTTKILLNKISHYIIIINILSFMLVILYAITLSKLLMRPLKLLNHKLSNMNEHLIKPIDIEKLPLEFESLGITINHLIARIQNFVKYQKELFIGTAHELKTPLAVIKLKNQVTLIKKRPPEEYIEALNVTNKTVNEMNIIISNILNIGRQEGAQLDKPIEVDVISILKQKAEDFKLLANQEGKNLKTNFEPDGFMATVQVSLINQIIQNFLQNAIKFTQKDKSIILRSRQDEVGLLIEVIDEGCGIDDSVDLFAPFKRQGNKSGVGLGLFLAKSAADALGANISITNRQDGIDGTIASLQINSKLSCILPRR